jgi:hypothetical protein
MASFSAELKTWQNSAQPKTLQNLVQVFGYKSFGIIFLLLMLGSALPIPTGGITNVFEIIVMLLALELIAGRQTIWLPKRWHNVSVAGVMQSKGIKRVVHYVERFEKRPAILGRISPHNSRLIGLLMLLFALAAFVAIPFSSLDTLPSMGAVLVALAMILEDRLLLIAGFLVGAAGIALILAIGNAVFGLF